MNKSKLFLTFALLGILFSGCGKKELDITLQEVMDGNVKIAVQNDGGAGISGLVVKIGEDFSSTSLEEKETDANGIVEFKNLLIGSYIVVIEDVELNGMVYNVVQPIQVINGVTKDFTILPTEYSGSVTISLIDDWTMEPLAGYNIGVFNTEDLNGYTFDDVIDACIQTGVTNAEGEVTFSNVPFNEYGVIVYVDENDFEIDEYSFYINEKGEEVEVNYYW